MRFLLLLVITDALEVKVHHDSILVAELIHDVVVILASLFVDEDRFQSILRPLLKHLDYIFRFELVRSRGLEDILEGSDELEAATSHFCWQSLDEFLAIRLK